MRGNPIVELTNQSTLFPAPLREASRKPDQEFLPFVERLCPAPRYAYLFSRTERERWDCHGDEVGMFTTAAAALAEDDDVRAKLYAGMDLNELDRILADFDAWREERTAAGVPDPEPTVIELMPPLPPWCRVDPSAGCRLPRCDCYQAAGTA